MARAQVQGVGVEELGAFPGDTAGDRVPKGPLHGLGIARLAGGQQEAPVPLEAGDGGARLGVRPVVGQLVGVADGLVPVPGPLPARHVGLGAVQVFPDGLGRLEQLVVPRLDGHVHHSRLQVQLAHGMAGCLPAVAYRLVVQEVGQREAAVPQPAGCRQRDPGPAPQLNLAPSQLQRPGVPTDAVVLDEGGLHLRVAAHPYQAAVPVFQRERPEEVLDQLVGHGRQLRAAGPAGGCGRLQQVPGTVQLMAPAQVLPGQLRVLALEPRVHVAVLALGAGYQAGGPVHELTHLRRQPPQTVPRRCFQDLVDIGVRKVQAVVRLLARPATGHLLQVGQGARAYELVQAMGQRLGAGGRAHRPVHRPRPSRASLSRARQPGRALGVVALLHAPSSHLCNLGPQSASGSLRHLSGVGKRYPQARPQSSTSPSKIVPTCTDMSGHGPGETLPQCSPREAVRPAYAGGVHGARPPTLTEVARLAGVSLTTASKAINGRDRIAEATRRRVLRAAKQLSYTPNLVAKSLARGQSSIIGVLLWDPTVHRFAMPIVVGAQSVLEEREFSAIIADARGDAGRFADLAIMLRQRNVDGLLVVGDMQGPTPSITASVRIPCVYVYGPTTNSRDVVHLVDDFAGAVAIVDHLLDQGRSRVAHITGPQHSPAVQQRVLGISRRLGQHGLRLVAPIRYGTWSQRWARQAASEVLAEAPELDAIACGSDQIAAAVLEAVVASGRRVPDDVAVTGYDNWPVFALETDPALTTLDMDLEHLGASAVSDLFALMGGARVGGGVRHHPGTLVVRGSTDRRRA